MIVSKNKEKTQKRETILIPAKATEVTLKADEKLELLEVYI